MKFLGIATATMAMTLGAAAITNSASAQSFGISVGSPGYSNYGYGNYGYGNYYRGGRSAYYGGYGVPYAYYGGPRVYGSTYYGGPRVFGSTQRNYYRGDYIRDGIPGGETRVNTRVYGYTQRRGDLVDRPVATTRVYGYTDRRERWDERTRLVRDGIPGNQLTRTSGGPRVAGFTRRSDLVIDPPVRSAGGCGTFRFWNGTTCVDARDR